MSTANPRRTTREIPQSGGQRVYIVPSRIDPVRRLSQGTRPKGFAKTPGLPQPTVPYQLPFKDDSRDFHSTLLDANNEQLKDIPSADLSRILGAANLLLGELVHAGADREQVIEGLAGFLVENAASISEGSQRGE